MTDNFENKDLFTDENISSVTENDSSANQEVKAEDISSTVNNDIADKAESENSYEWNSQSSSTGEYRHSYVNGRNSEAAHNPNKYENLYSGTYSNNSYGNVNPYAGRSYSTERNTGSAAGQGTVSDTTTNTNAVSGTAQNTGYNNYNTSYTDNNRHSNFSNNGYGNTSYNNGSYEKKYDNYSKEFVASPYNSNTANTAKPKRTRAKKQVSRGFIAAIMIISIILSGAVGFGGGFLANRLSKSSGGSGVNINQVAADSASAKSDEALSGTTTSIVKKTADSVVEIATEKVVTGSFAQQYVQNGAGSGVIISEDGYIITNNHVIEGAENIKVTLRDGTTSYNAALIGSDENEDIALIKVDATNLTAATFGDSSKLAVGDYVIAIGNPLGELGGTVTDGIISALAREVIIDGNSMTLLQHNAQISPGNSGGGLFNSNGELIGIVNAKDSATEVEGIAFAIPINNVLDIINDLKNYGYVTGRIDLGMQLTDITSRDTAFFYGVNKTGCYVLSVTRGSNAEEAGFKTGDLITKVDGTEVSESADIDTLLKDAKVGDKVKFTIYRSGKTADITLTLAEYTPSSSNTNSQNNQQNDSNNSIWDDMFNR